LIKRWMAAVAAAMLAFAACAADDYPNRPIRLVVPFPPGGGTDIMSRVVAKKLSDANGWNVVVENHPGAGGNVGIDTAVRAPKDGYTIVMGQTSNLAINPTLYKKLSYDPLKDLAPVVLVGQGPIAIAVNASSGYKSLADLINAAKAKPGQLTMATPGNGTVAHLSGVRLMNAAGVKFEHVPYKGASAAIPDLMGGRVDFYMASVPSIQGHVASGQLRAIAVTSSKRSPVLRDAPTIAETYPGFQAVTWFGILAPAGTPQPVIDKLNAKINEALKDADVRHAIEKEGGTVEGGTPQEFQKLIRDEIGAWATVVKQSGAKVD
jgi:tripartite-type tricarboxylate transporter receptor subunit TctC